jgi:hypothetical protein
MQARTLSITISREWSGLYEEFRHPEAFPRWASGLSDASLQRDGDDWTARGPEGPVRIRFSPPNPFGVMDHWVELGKGREVYVPLRIIPNDTGAEVMLTLFRQPGITEASFARDIAWVERDLLALKRLAEGCAAASG